MAYSKIRKNKKALKLALKLLKEAPRSRSAFWQVMDALAKLKKVGKAKKLAAARLATMPNDEWARLNLAFVFAYKSMVAEAEKELDAVIKAKGSPLAYSFRAWLQLFKAKLDKKAALRDAMQAARLTQFEKDFALETLAVVAAETGELKIAQMALKKLFVEEGRIRPVKTEWYAYGRIAEKTGLVDVAINAYRKVPNAHPDDPLSTYALARKRLAALGRGTASAGARKVIRSRKRRR